MASYPGELDGNVCGSFWHCLSDSGTRDTCSNGRVPTLVVVVGGSVAVVEKRDFHGVLKLWWLPEWQKILFKIVQHLIHNKVKIY